nr:MAG: hypothetical protein [Bacteriophage sp.]
MKLVVLKPFRDKNDHQTIYQSGDHISTNDISRVNNLVKNGMCEIVSVGDDKEEDKKPETISFQQKDYGLDEVKAALEEIGNPAAKNAGVKGVSKKLEELTEEQAASLSEILKREV